MRERGGEGEEEGEGEGELEEEGERGDLKWALDPACLGVNPSCGPCLGNLDTTPFIVSSMK